MERGEGSEETAAPSSISPRSLTPPLRRPRPGRRPRRSTGGPTSLPILFKRHQPPEAPLQPLGPTLGRHPRPKAAARGSTKHPCPRSFLLPAPLPRPPSHLRDLFATVTQNRQSPRSRRPLFSQVAFPGPRALPRARCPPLP